MKIKRFKAGIISSCTRRQCSPNLPGIRAGGSNPVWGFAGRWGALQKRSHVFLLEGLGWGGGGCPRTPLGCRKAKGSLTR